MSRPSVFINPRINQKIHVNPFFLNPTKSPSVPSSNVHVNPLFIRKTAEPSTFFESPPLAIASPNGNRHKLVRKISANSSPAAAVSPVKVAPKIVIPKPAIVRSKHKLIRKNVNKNTPKKVVPRSIHKKLVVLKINGVTYKSSRTKLLRTNSNQASSQSNFSFKKELLRSDKLISLTSGKFILKNRGQLVQRLPHGNSIDPRGKCIEVAGMSFASLGDGNYRRIANIRRNYLATTKRKTINVLRNQLKKTNEPCQIFRRLGRCLALQRGRCPKVHDTKQIMICPGFVKGACNRQKCFLSHAISLAKMPVCKFYLQGVCLSENCPYLHKKLGENVIICPDFLKGFCSLAEKCPRKHEFPSKPLKEDLKKQEKPKKEEGVKPSRYYKQEAPTISEEHQKKLEKMLGKIHRLKEHKKALEAAQKNEVYHPKIHNKKEENELEQEEKETKPRPPRGPLPDYIAI